MLAEARVTSGLTTMSPTNIQAVQEWLAAHFRFLLHFTRPVPRASICPSSCSLLITSQTISRSSFDIIRCAGDQPLPHPPE